MVMKSSDDALAANLRAKIAEIDAELKNYQETFRRIRKLGETRESLAHSLACIVPNGTKDVVHVEAIGSILFASKGPKYVAIQTFHTIGRDGKALRIGQVMTFATAQGWRPDSKHPKLLLRGAIERLVESDHLERLEDEGIVAYRQKPKFAELIRPHFAPGT